MNGPALGAMACVLLVAVPVGLLIGAAILRAAVSLANKCLPKEVERDYEDEWDDDERPRRSALSPIPEPSLGKAMGIVFINAVVGFIISIPINLVLGVGFANMGAQQDPVKALVASLIQLPIGFLVAAGILTGMLPTSFPRACLVVLFQYLIVFVLCIVIAVPLFALGFMLGR